MMLGFPVLPRPVQSSSLWPGPRKVKIIIIIMLGFPSELSNLLLFGPSQEKSMERSKNKNNNNDTVPPRSSQSSSLRGKKSVEEVKIIIITAR